VKEFLLFCSGANREVLKECPTEETKYVGIGATILLTAVLATLSGGYALHTVFGSLVAAVPFGVLWGMVIFNLDRVIVSGMRKQAHVLVDLLYAVPRLVLAVLLAIVISRPLELRLFEAELEEQWQRTQLATRVQDQSTIESGSHARLAELTAENRRLEEESQARYRAFKAAEEAWIREKEGTAGTGIPGAGPVFAEKQRVMELAAGELERTRAQNEPRIGGNREEIARIQRERETLLAETDRTRSGANGFLARMRAFGELQAADPTVRWASLFITLLFISLETAPVLVKLLSTMSPYRPYDELLEKREFELVEAAKQEIRVRRNQLKAEADRTIADQKDHADAEMQLTADRHQLRMNAELRANEALIRQISDAQVELAEELVEQWKLGEMDRIRGGSGGYAQTAA
jgi:hypothetical protein